MSTSEDRVRRDALAREIACRLGMASLDELRVVDMILVALERSRDREGLLDLDANHRDAQDWRRDAMLSAAALHALPDAKFDLNGSERDYRTGWNAAIDHIVAAFTQGADARVFNVIARIKQIDHERARLYEELAEEHLESIERQRARDTARIIKPVAASFDVSDEGAA